MHTSSSADLHRWRGRDTLAAASLFLATAAIVLWQNAHLAVLWDLSYVLETAARISHGQIPYRDFPLAHAPLTFALHALLIRLTGRVFFFHVLLIAALGGLGTVLAWRIALRSLRRPLDRPGVWPLALLLAAPLAFLGLYCVFPHPSYDCDAMLAVLIALFLLQKIDEHRPVLAFAAGAAAVVFLVFLLLLANKFAPTRPGPRSLVLVLAGAATALALALGSLHLIAGIENYLHWTLGFAAHRRMPGLAAMASIYTDRFLPLALASLLAGLLLLRGPLTRHGWTATAWARRAAFLLLAAPLLFPLAALALSEESEGRGDAFLALFPVLLVLCGLLTLARLRALRTGLTLAALLPLAALAAAHGTLMSQQLWGSTYALWPIFSYLLAEVLGELTQVPRARWIGPAVALASAVTLLVCGIAYTLSEERLSYVALSDAAPATSTHPALAGLHAPGPYLADLDELLDYAEARIAPEDAVLLLPGEDPFYFATGRAPRFPVLLFDPATDPFSAGELAAEARKQQVKWLILKHDLQMDSDPTPDRDATLAALLPDYALTTRLRAYDIYRRNE